MGKSNNAFTYLSTTGSGVAIGTNIDLGGVFRGSDLAGTVILKVGATTVLTMSADRSLLFEGVPIALTGAVTMTSSAGDHFVVLYRDRAK